MSEGRESARVCGYGMIGKEAPHHRPEPRALFCHALVPPSSKFLADLQQLRPFPITPRVPGKLEAALPRARTDMGKA
jgi:hypothetical protein